MTTIQFERGPDGFLGFTCQGHSGYAEAGEDIVCAAITSALRLCECIIDDAFEADTLLTFGDEAAKIQLQMNPDGQEYPACEKVLEGFYLYMQQLSRENPDYLRVLEV